MYNDKMRGHILGRYRCPYHGQGCSVADEVREIKRATRTRERVSTKNEIEIGIEEYYEERLIMSQRQAEEKQ